MSAAQLPMRMRIANETVNPVSDEDGPLILDVGQRTVVSSQNAVLGTILILIGLVQIFFGFKLIRLTLVLTGFVSWAVVAIILMVTLRWELAYQLFKPARYYFWMWVLAGLLGALLSFRYWDLGVSFAGGFGGFAVAMGIIAASNHSMSNVGRYILLASLILIGAAIATFYERFSIILGTSFGGAFMFMYGVDEFVQVGYREMIVIFRFAGKTLTYHPNKKVFTMIGCSLALALCGIAWEFWHHANPLLMDRKALFRIYGRPFGKRPRKLVGQRIKRSVRSMGWYEYLTGCLCLRRKTAEEVLFEDEEACSESPIAAVVHESKHSEEGVAPGTSALHDLDEKLQGNCSPEPGAQCTTGTSSETASVQNSEDQGESGISLSTLKPVQVVIEETDYQCMDDDETVPVEAHTESIVLGDGGRTVSETRTASLATETTTEYGSTRTQHHATTTTTTTSTTSRSVSTAESTLPSIHGPQTPTRPGVSVVSESHHLHSSTSTSMSTSEVRTVSSSVQGASTLKS
ncbi:hypothetical protein BGZ70_010456 [Mortierella alpina]|uniref:Transmembrane protein 198 n=1 Tax=Mortierella alpina TaxID=64518 RepID=A0A9P6IZB1_MORAP|nr:hypothetical protein BGZ70_010456 [Mortierella alpina]